MTMLNKINLTFISACIISLCLVTLLVPIPLGVQIALFLIGSLIIGLPHGAMDYDIAKFLNLCNTFKDKAYFFTGYLMIAALNFALWVWMPVAGFLFLIALTVWHFSEDWVLNTKEHSRLFILLRKLFFGAGFICLPSMLNTPELIDILSILMPTDDSETAVQLLSTLSIPLLILMIGCLFVDLVKKRYMDLMLGGIFISSGLFLPPILFLFLYFCLLHGPRHTLELYRLLNYQSFGEMLKRQVPIMVLTIMLLGLAYVFYQDMVGPNEAIFSSLIITIACLTTPHMILIEYLNKKLL